MESDEQERTVLVVEQDENQRDLIATWLMDEGYTVLTCPGPRGPSYTCLGGRGLPCPLAGAAQTVVVNLRLTSDIVMDGSPAWQLMLYYLERGRHVVALVGDEDAVRPWSDEDVITVARPPQRAELMAAVRGASLGLASQGRNG